MIQKIENRIQELQSAARQHELAMIQMSGAIQELTNLLSQLKKEVVNVEEIKQP